MRRRKLRLAGLLGGILAIAVSVSATISASPTRASWLDSEWVKSPVSTLDCAPGAGQFSSRAAGKLLGGRLVGVDLDALASIDGVTVTNSASGVQVTPPVPISDPLGNDAYANPLDVTALSALNVSLGNLLVLPLGADVGIVNNYARSVDNGLSVGASGAVNNSGGVQLTSTPPGSDPPKIGTLQLGKILQAALGTGLGGGISGLTDARLDVGAVASSASLDACAGAWAGDMASTLARNYLVAGLGLDIDSPLVGNLVTGVKSTLNGVDGTIEALAGSAGVLNGLTTGLTTALTGLLGALNLGSVSITNLTADLDLTAVNALLDDTISDDAGIVSIDLAAGTISIDLAGLLGSVHGTSGVNGLAPNTQLLVNASVVNALTAAVTQALVNWVDDITAALKLALQLVKISATVKVSLLQTGPTPVASVLLTIPQTSLANLLAGTVSVTSSIELAGGGPCTALTLVLCGLINVLVTPLVNAVGKTLGTVLNDALFSSPGNVLATTSATLLGLTAPLVAFVGAATTALFGESGLLSLTVNAQNAPRPANANPLPSWAAALPGPDAATHSSGQFDVAALRLTALATLLPGALVQLDFARSSVGSNTRR